MTTNSQKLTRAIRKHCRVAFLREFDDALEVYPGEVSAAFMLVQERAEGWNERGIIRDIRDVYIELGEAVEVSDEERARRAELVAGNACYTFKHRGKFWDSKITNSDFEKKYS